MSAFRWQDFLPTAPSSEKAYVSSGLHFSRTLLQEGNYSGGIEGGYLVSIATGPCMLTRHTEHGFDIGQLALHDILVTPPSRRVEWQVTGAASFTNVFFSERYLARVAGSIAHPGPLTIKPMFRHKDRLMEGVFSVLEEQLEATDYHDHIYLEAMARTLCIHLLHINVVKDAARLASRQRTLSFDQMEKIRACVIEKLQERILTSELARCAHISDYHFYRVFKRTTGMTPQQFIKKCRLERAKLLMEQTSLALSEIAYKTGFTDQSHLAREFRLGYGMTPRQVRAQSEYDRNLSLAL